MKKLKHEAELFKAALLAGVKYAEGRGAVEFEPTDSASQKLWYIYRLRAQKKVIHPRPEAEVPEATMRHNPPIWYPKRRPQAHPLLKKAAPGGPPGAPRHGRRPMIEPGTAPGAQKRCTGTTGAGGAPAGLRNFPRAKQVIASTRACGFCPLGAGLRPGILSAGN